jgi:hypothetical protein
MRASWHEGQGYLLGGGREGAWYLLEKEENLRKEDTAG